MPRKQKRSNGQEYGEEETFRRICSPMFRYPSPGIGARGTVPTHPHLGTLEVTEDDDPSLLTVRNRRGQSFRLGKACFQPE